jgi:predicted DNA-binding transcriptional regulator YafY
MSWLAPSVVGMNRTDRLYAVVEELRAVAPRPRSARWLADRFEVSARTIERDISALEQSGVPVWAQPGRSGGYCLDKERTLPPVNFTPGEAMALAVALRGVAGTPFGQDGAAALRKVVAAMRKDDAEAARHLAARVYLVSDASPPPVPAVITDALAARRVLRIGYADRHGVVTRRDIEPLGYVGVTDRWYLLAWCRLRDAVRAFRTDRITTVTVTAQVPAPRALRGEDLDIPPSRLQRLALD